MIGWRDAGLAAALVLLTTLPAAPHQFNVFASVDCGSVEVEATLENGRPPATGEVRLRDADDKVILTLDLGDTGKKRVSLEGVDTSGGLTVEVESGAHSDYWVLTPEDITRTCSA